MGGTRYTSPIFKHNEVRTERGILRVGHLFRLKQHSPMPSEASKQFNGPARN